MAESTKKRFGLLGKNISYSFSKGYFAEKFASGSLNDLSYENFDLQDISEFETLIENNHQELAGINVTIPYKEAVIPFLDKLSKKAKLIGAVNTIKFTRNGKLKGYNTDYYGFKKAIKPLLAEHHKKALILGTGGASKGVCFALDELGITYTFVSRIKNENTISYEDLDQDAFAEHTIVINATNEGSISPNTIVVEIDDNNNHIRALSS